MWDIKGGKTFTLKDVVFNRDINIFKSVIMDESHRLKDPTAQQTMFTRGIVEGKEWRILLSGTRLSITHKTSLHNSPSWGDCSLTSVAVANSFADYGENENLSELSDKLYDTCMIRREKAKVLTQLPDKTRTDLYVEISNRDEYDLAAAPTSPPICANTPSVPTATSGAKCAWRLW